MIQLLEVFRDRVDANNPPNQVLVSEQFRKELKALSRDTELEATGALIYRSSGLTILPLGQLGEKIGLTPILEIKQKELDFIGIQAEALSFVGKIRGLLGRRNEYRGSYLFLLPGELLGANEAALRKLQPKVLFESTESFGGVVHSHKGQKGVNDKDICLPSFPDLVNLVTMDVAQNNLSIIVGQSSFSVTAKTSKTPVVYTGSFSGSYPRLAADITQINNPQEEFATDLKAHRTDLRNWTGTLSLAIYRGHLYSETADRKF